MVYPALSKHASREDMTGGAPPSVSFMWYRIGVHVRSKTNSIAATVYQCTMGAVLRAPATAVVGCALIPPPLKQLVVVRSFSCFCVVWKSRTACFLFVFAAVLHCQFHFYWTTIFSCIVVPCMYAASICCVYSSIWARRADTFASNRWI